MTKKSKSEYAKENAMVISLKVRCGYCLEEMDIEFEKVSILSDTSPCELCGSHGYVEIDTKCPHCGKLIEVEVRSW